MVQSGALDPPINSCTHLHDAKLRFRHRLLGTHRLL